MSPDAPAAWTHAKIIVSGGFGVGKTTLVGSTSEIEPLTTEENLTEISAGIDSLTGVEGKDTTTVAMDFGRLTFPAQRLVLYLFGTPGQDRFWHSWDDLIVGAVGAVVLVDTRRLDSAFTSVGYFEQCGIPFAIGVNEFDGAPYRYTPAEVREALEIPGQVPIIACDARDKHSALTVLLTLVDHAIARQSPQPPIGAPA